MDMRFWDFTLGFYGGAGVSEALVQLQDECGLDVNLLLYAIWRGRAGQVLTQADARAAEAAIATWREQVTEPLRDLRRRLKQAEWTGLPPASRERAEGSFRERVKAAELDSEELTQAALESLPVSDAGEGGVAGNLAAVYQALAPAAAQPRAAELCAVLAGAAAAYSVSSSG